MGLPVPMKTLPLVLLSLCAFTGKDLDAQVRVVPVTDHAALLADANPQLAANKRLVYDFWREVFEAGHMELAERYLTESYVQHNPNVPTGRAAFVAFFSKFVKPTPIAARVKAPLIAILADGDRVTLCFAREAPDPKNPGQTYTTTWFDMFRLENGKIAEHWDPAEKH
jgi:predicted SnoaL-like aldol condensation-catalyzing enzyme